MADPQKTARVHQLTETEWATFSGLLDEALMIEPHRVNDWLAGLLPAHPSLVPLLVEALRADSEVRASGASGVPQMPGDGNGADAYLFSAGRQFGPYELIEPLGRGGMGEVWRARRHDDPALRGIALKLPHTWLLTAPMRRRLAREKEILASLDHPNIVQLLDAGVADDGQPWLALERIDGERIDVYCRERRLSLPARLALFEQVLGAVETAHARLVIHRDLKPSNILVTADGTVKLLDFGIAKLLDDTGLGEETELTTLGGRAVTLDYAAPEQIGGGTLTAATDIYALGVVLYELLVGQRPFSARRSRQPAHAPDLPPLVSERVIEAHAKTVGGLSANALRKALRGDLDAILAQSLQAAPALRYRAVGGFAEDLRRHRAFEPISARHISRLARAARFVRRHRRALSVSALLLAVILAGAGLSLWQAQRATREFRRADATKNFLIDVLMASDRLTASDKPAGSASARELLDSIFDQLAPRLAEHPDTQIELLDQAGRIYRQWHARERLVQAEHRYRALVAEHYGPGDPRLVKSLLYQASAYGDYSAGQADAGPLLAEAGRLIQQYGLTGSELEAQWLMETGRRQIKPLGASPEAIASLTRAVALFVERQPLSDRRGWVEAYLAEALAGGGQPHEALTLTHATLARERQREKPNDWLLAYQQIRVGQYLRELGRLDAALDAYRQGDAVVLKTFGRDVDTHWDAVRWQATLLAWQGDDAAAGQLFADEYAELMKFSTEGKDEGAAWLRWSYAQWLLGQGRAAEALPLLLRALPVPSATNPAPELPFEVRATLGEAYEALGRLQAAAAAFAQARAEAMAFGPADHARVLAVREAWADFQLRHAPAADAAAADAELHEVVRLGAARPMLATVRARLALAGLARQRGERDAARTFAQGAQQGLQGITELFDPRRRTALQQAIDRQLR